MLSHEKVWAAIDALALQNGLSTSGLARRAGLDPTTFNRSKRITGDGRLRWPSTESLAKVLDATGEGLKSFADRVEATEPQTPQNVNLVPFAGFSEVAQKAFFDSTGRPAGTGWETFPYPTPQAKGEFALEVSSNDLLPLYRRGDIIIVVPSAPTRRGDRVVVKPKNASLAVYTFFARSPERLEFQAIGDTRKVQSYYRSEIDWTARIIWASQ